MHGILRRGLAAAAFAAAVAIGSQGAAAAGATAAGHSDARAAAPSLSEIDTGFSQGELEAFAVAAVRVVALYQRHDAYDRELSAEELAEIERRAAAEIEATDGIDRERYQAVALAAFRDPALRERVHAILNRMERAPEVDLMPEQSAPRASK